METHFTDKFDEGQYDRVITAGGDGSDTTVAASVAIFDDEGLRTRVNILSKAGASCAQDVRCVGSLVFIGFGRYLFILDAKAGEVIGHRLDGYFGRMYDGSDFEGLPR